MKKIVISILCILAFASISFASDVETVNGGRTTQDFVAGAPHMFYSYVYDSADSDLIPTQVVTNNAVLRVSFWSQLTQIWHRYYIVTDPAGSMIYFNDSNSTSVTGGTQFFGSVTVSTLPVGDYIFTFVSAGAVGGLVVSDQFPFSIR